MADSPKQSRYYTYIAPVIKNPFVRSSAPYIFNIVSITIFIIFAIRPTITTILVLQKNTANNQIILDGLNAKAKSLTEARNNLTGMDVNLKKKVVSAIPSTPSVPSLVATLQNSLNSTGTISALQIQ